MDILTTIAKKTETTKAPARKLVKRYLVCVGSAAAMRSRRFYDLAKARRIVARAKRLGLDAYVSSPVMLAA